MEEMNTTSLRRVYEEERSAGFSTITPLRLVTALVNDSLDDGNDETRIEMVVEVIGKCIKAAPSDMPADDPFLVTWRECLRICRTLDTEGPEAARDRLLALPIAARAGLFDAS